MIPQQSAAWLLVVSVVSLGPLTSVRAEDSALEADVRKGADAVEQKVIR
jgi:hypothetical protein